MEYTFAYTVCEGVVRIDVLIRSNVEKDGVDLGKYGGDHAGRYDLPLGAHYRFVYYREVRPSFDLNGSKLPHRARCMKACILIGVLISLQENAGYFSKKTVVAKTDQLKRTLVWLCLCCQKPVLQVMILFNSCYSTGCVSVATVGSAAPA